MNDNKQLVLRVHKSLDRFTEAVVNSDVVSSVSDLQLHIDRLRDDIFATNENVDFEVADCRHIKADVMVSSTDTETEPIKALERIEMLERAVDQHKHESEVVASESANKLVINTDHVAHLEGRVRELVDHESQLNAELEHMRLADHQRTLEQNQQVLALRAEVDTLRKNEVSFRENLSQMTVRCDEQLSQAKSDNTEAVGRLTVMLQDNQSQLLSVLTELDAAKQQLEITAGKLDERSTQLEDALQQLKTSEDSIDEMRRSGSDLRKTVGTLVSERDLLAERLTAYESSAVGGVVGAEELLRQTSDLEKQLAERVGTVVKLESVVSDLQDVIRSRDGREEALVAENSRLQEKLESAITDQLRTMAGLHGKVQLFEQVVVQKDREISNLRIEVASRKEAGSSSHLSGSSFGKLVAASSETDADRRLSRLQDIFRQMNAAHADEVSSLKKQLEQASVDMQVFKDHAKNQFENQQEKVLTVKFLAVLNNTIDPGYPEGLTPNEINFNLVQGLSR